VVSDIVTASGKYNFELLRIPVKSNWNITRCRSLLEDYDDKTICDYIEFGWPVSHTLVKKLNQKTENHAGVLQYEEAIDEYLKVEVERGSAIGPFQKNPFNREIAISPLNAIPKKDTVEPRVILDLSFPQGSSINDGISATHYLGEEISTIYPRVDDLVDLIHKKGRGCLLFKKDLKKAYRQIPIDPSDIPLLGYKWRGNLYFDSSLPMGLRSSAYICQRVTSAVSYLMIRNGFSLLNYLDDFAGAEVPGKAMAAYNKLGEILQQMGLKESPSKACSPTEVMSFLGVLFDTNKLTLEVTVERLNEIQDLLGTWQKKRSATKKELESLIGKLMFITKCVRGSRVFMARILAALREMDNDISYKLDVELMKDLEWWDCFLRKFNGTVMMPFQDWSKPDSVIAVDACMTGLGGICWGTNEVFHIKLPLDYTGNKFHINELECLCLVISLKIWGKSLQRKKILIFSDNMVTVSVVNSGKSHTKFLQACIREIAFVMCTNESEIRAIHIEGKENRVPDYLSRWYNDGKYQGLFWNEMLRLDRLHNVKEIEVPLDLLTLKSTW